MYSYFLGLIEIGFYLIIIKFFNIYLALIFIINYFNNPVACVEKYTYWLRLFLFA